MVTIAPRVVVLPFRGLTASKMCLSRGLNPSRLFPSHDVDLSDLISGPTRDMWSSEGNDITSAISSTTIVLAVILLALGSCYLR